MQIDRTMRDIQDVARYVGLTLISKGLSVSPLKLQKILYYVQSWYMVFFGRCNTLFVDKPQAWVNGPVYPSVYHRYKDKVANMCDHMRASHFDINEEGGVIDELRLLSDKMELNREEIELIDSIVMLYGSKTQNALIFLTHAEKPWAEKREGLSPFERSQAELSLDTMYEYYKDRHEKSRVKA